MADREAMKAHFSRFVVMDAIGVALLIAGFIGDVGFGVGAFKLLWAAAGLGLVGVMTWFVLGVRKLGREG